MTNNNKFTNYYKLLGIDPKADRQTVKQAYLSRVKEWHPDKNPHEPKYAEKMLISIKMAFDEIMKSRK